MPGKSALATENVNMNVLSDEELYKLESISKKVRITIIKMLKEARSGHPGGSLSVTDILVALYFKIMNHDPANPGWDKRDRLVLSKGHAAPALYTVLAEAGYFDKKLLLTLRKWNSILQGHPDRLLTPGVEMSTGSLGQGLSIATGIAIGAKLDKNDIFVYAVCSDGEHQEGMTWEAVMSAAKFNLSNLIMFLDKNGLQIDGRTEFIMPVEPLKDKYLAFGWNVLEADGHSFTSLIDNVNKAKKFKDKPTVIICSTIKGKGVDFMENKAEWHGKAPNEEQAEKAIESLEKKEIG